MKYSLLVFLFAIQHTVIAQDMVFSANQVIQKSINYHDPKGKLDSKTTTLDLTETRPNGNDRKTSLQWNMAKETYSKSSNRNGKPVISTFKKGQMTFTIDGEEVKSEEDLKKYKLSTDREQMLKNYYQYLWLLPMKLKDEGTIISPKVESKDFFGKSSLQVKITYDPSVGDDIWYFYFHPETYALQGYRFYHDESKNDGEYILLSGETIYKNIRLPKKREWYTHKEDKFLGADILDTITYR